MNKHVLLCLSNHPAYRLTAQAGGADAYIGKDTLYAGLVPAIRRPALDEHPGATNSN